MKKVIAAMAAMFIAVVLLGGLWGILLKPIMGGGGTDLSFIYERRKHIEGKSFDNCLLFDLATEPLEETAERLETLQEIGRALEQLPPLQRWRFILHFFYGYSYSEIAKMQDCNKSAVMRSVHSALKKIRNNVAA